MHSGSRRGLWLPVLIVLPALVTAAALWYRRQPPKLSWRELPTISRIAPREPPLSRGEGGPIPPRDGSGRGPAFPRPPGGTQPFGLMFPKVSARYERQETCRQRIRHLTMALGMYAMDYDDRLPPARRWCDATYAYVRSDRLYRCPDVEKGYGYAFNSRLGSVVRSDIPAPAYVIVLFDSSSKAKNAADPVSSLCNPPRHPSGNVISYLDGRVALRGPNQRF